MAHPLATYAFQLSGPFFFLFLVFPDKEAERKKDEVRRAHARVTSTQPGFVVARHRNNSAVSIAAERARRKRVVCYDERPAHVRARRRGRFDRREKMCCPLIK
ncbi:hypothetical protein MRX96_056496 [Rhipicephalus microplus]